MRALDDTSGPWIGWSVQYGRRIHERLVLRVGGGTIRGTGEDADGDFEIEGDYDSGGEVAIVRRYTYCTSGAEGVGVPYLYRGRWDGALISGTWKAIPVPHDGGPFEMWPEDAMEEVRFEERKAAAPLGVG